MLSKIINTRPTADQWVKLTLVKTLRWWLMVVVHIHNIQKSLPVGQVTIGNTQEPVY